MPVGLQPQPDRAILNARAIPLRRSCVRKRERTFSSACIEPRFETQRMQPVEDQQARHQFVPPKLSMRLAPAVAQPRESTPVFAPSPAPCRSITSCTSSCTVVRRLDRRPPRSRQATFDRFEPLLELRLPGMRSPAMRPRQPFKPNIGEWRVSSILPPPSYICTPQGRQGSKLRTARMMSMPLNLSRPFSSKIGVFCTASS